MSEELLQIEPISIGRYQYYKIGATTLSQLKKAKIIKANIPKSISNKKPDGLVVLTGGIVKAIIEYKQPSELNTTQKINKAIEQEIEVAKHLCKLLIVTDGSKTFWINALNGNDIIENKSKLKETFCVKKILKKEITKEQLLYLELLFDKIDHSLTKSNDIISEPKILDPSQLAKSVWQKIWINTGKEPEKCLYNVVELFVFKFLSDIGVLESHNNFQSVYNLKTKFTHLEALKHYADRCRKDINSLFPKGKDGTTIINGTIFVNEKGEANKSQSFLFGEVLEDFQDYDNKHGSFKYIQREFKTRLYESFLRQNAGIKLLGQYFTPRNVVRAMVEMSNASILQKDARVCDPFCGVGGFVLETIVENKNIYSGYEPKNDIIDPSIKVVGYDKGSDEKDDERTIILAKANMLIYFSDLLVKYHSNENLKEFSEKVFNKTFTLLRTNLGTFKQINDENYDLILTNPPYVTSGSSTLKKTIEDNNDLKTFYTSSGRGTESLAIEWIIKNLKRGSGQALVVVPDGLMNQKNMLDFIKSNCFIKGIISLPTRTFYSTPKKTYILIIEKKYDKEIQKIPVFTYLVSEIGETRDSNRFPIEQNDLNEAVCLFNQFKGSPNNFKSTSNRCKSVLFENFDNQKNWIVDKWWSNEDRIKLGINDEISDITEEEFYNLLFDIRKTISEFLPK